MGSDMDLQEAQLTIRYGKPHHAEWAKSLDGRIRSGGIWKSDKQRKYYERLATIQPGSAKDPLTRELHKGARSKLRNIKASHRLLICRYRASPDGKQWFVKASIYEFNDEGMIRKWTVSADKQGGWGWNRAEVSWQRTGFKNDAKEIALPRSNVGQRQAEQVALRVARKYKINTMPADQLRKTVMRELLNLNPIVVQYKKAVQYELGKAPHAPQNMDAWKEVIAGDIEKVISSIGEIKKDRSGLPRFGKQPKKNHKEKTPASELPNFGSKALKAGLRLQNEVVAAIGVDIVEGKRVFWLEQRSGEVFRYEHSRGEFSGFKKHLSEELGKDQANHVLVALRDKSKEVARVAARG